MSTQLKLGANDTIFLEEFHKIPLVSIVVALRTGNAHEPTGKEGLARITARMTRRGCEGLDAPTIDETIDRLGAEMAVDTGASSVAIHAQCIGRNAEAFADLLGRMLSKPTFPEKEFQRLQRETLAEIDEMQDNDRSLAQRALRLALFDKHPYGRDGAGTAKSVAGLTVADVRAYYETHFTRGNIVLGFAGDVTEAQARSLAERIVGTLPDRGPAADTVPAPDFPKGRHLFFVDKPERTQTQILIGTEGTWAHDDDHAALGVGTAILGGTFTSRLMREVRSKRGWSYGASARTTIDRHRHAFSMWTFPAATDASACISLELELLESWVNDGVTQEETDFIKAYLTRSYAFDVDTANKRLHHTVDTEILRLPATYYSGYVERISKLERQAVLQGIQNRIRPEDLVFVVVGTAKDILEPVTKAIPGLTSTKVLPFDEPW